MRRGLPLAPSDLVQARARKQVRVAGRVVVARGRSFDLADAFASLRVRCEHEPGVSEGDLLIVSGHWTGKALEGARLVEHQPCPAPRAAGEFWRLALSPAGRALAARARALSVVREYFGEQGFVEVDTPLRVPAPGVDQHMDAVRTEDGYLVTSPEYHMKRLLVGGMPRIFQIGRATRRGERGALHEPEFSMLEWYRAFAGQDDVMRDTEELAVRVLRALAGKTLRTRERPRAIDLRLPFPRLTIRDAFRRHAGISDAADLAATDEDRYFELYVERVEPALARLSRPVFLCDYPATQAALARRSPSDSSVAERFELYVAGVELCNGYGELTDPTEQRARILSDRKRRRAERRRVYPVDERFLAALGEGLPPSAGNALGLDRLVMLALGEQSLEGVVSFPSGRI